MGERRIIMIKPIVYMAISLGILAIIFLLGPELTNKTISKAKGSDLARYMEKLKMQQKSNETGAGPSLPLFDAEQTSEYRTATFALG